MDELAELVHLQTQAQGLAGEMLVMQAGTGDEPVNLQAPVRAPGLAAGASQVSACGNLGALAEGVQFQGTSTGAVADCGALTGWLACH